MFGHTTRLNMFFFNCFFFKIIFQVQLYPFSLQHFPMHPRPPIPTLNTTALWLCLWSFIYTLWQLFLFFPPSPSSLPSGHSRFVLYFSVSSSFLLICLFCWLGSTYRWDHVVFVFHIWLISLNTMLSRSIHALRNRSFFDLLHSIPLCKCTTGFWSTHLLMGT